MNPAGSLKWQMVNGKRQKAKWTRALVSLLLTVTCMARDASANGFVESPSVGAKLYGPTTLADQGHFQILIFERIGPSQLIEEE